MSTPPRPPAISPTRAIARATVVIRGGPFNVSHDVPRVTVGGVPALVTFAARDRLAITVPPGPEGAQRVLVEGGAHGELVIHVGEVIATGIHQVDNPAIDRDGAVYLTYSGSRGQQAPVSLYRVPPGGAREVFAGGITNATSMAFDAEGRLHVSSRFDGTVLRVDRSGSAEVVASDLGIACGLAFDPEGALIVGDRSGTVFRVRDEAKAAEVVATLPASTAAFHLAVAPDGAIHVTGPTLSSCDAVYRIGEPGGAVRALTRRFGRPQGLAFDARGRLYVAEALAAVSGIYRLEQSGGAELIVSGPELVGLAFGPGGELVVASNETAWRFAGADAPWC